MTTEITTWEIQAYRYMEGKKDDAQLFIDWAISMLLAGNDSPTLRILAGLYSSESTIDEIDSFLMKAFQELEIPVLKEKAAIKNYAYQLLTLMINGDIKKEEALNILSRIEIERDFTADLTAFYGLNIELGELATPAFEIHLREAVREEIWQIVFQTAHEWLEKYQEFNIG